MGIIRWTTKDGEQSVASMCWPSAVKTHLALIAQGQCRTIITERVDMCKPHG